MSHAPVFFDYKAILLHMLNPERGDRFAARHIKFYIKPNKTHKKIGKEPY
jgi:hypothetical protein